MEFSSDSEDEEKKHTQSGLRVNHLGMILEAVNHHENQSDEDYENSDESSSNDSEDGITSELRKISDGAEK